MLEGLAIYLRSVYGATPDAAKLERDAVAFAKRCKAMGLTWVALGAVWQEMKAGVITTRFLNTPTECRAYAKALRDVGLIPYVWGYPWQGAEQRFVSGMIECAGDDGLHLLDPELGMNPSRDSSPNGMTKANASATQIMSGLRADPATKVIGLSTFGGIPGWFPLRAFLRAGVDFAGGQTYTDDTTIDTSIASFLAEMKLTGSTAQLVPNYGIYAHDADGTTRKKTPAELSAHLDEFINEGEPVHALIGWASNFLTPPLEQVLATFAVKLRAHVG